MPPSTSSHTSSGTRFRGLALVGGHHALDFVNTIKYRGAEDTGDRLGTFADVSDWAWTAGLISNAEAMAIDRSARSKSEFVRLFGGIIAFREQLRLLFPVPAPCDPAYLAALTTVGLAITQLRPFARIDPESTVLTYEHRVGGPGDLKDRIVAAAGELLAQRRDVRIKVCGGDDCDWLFIDRTNAGRRKWCDSRTCGNTVRVRRHRSRQMPRLSG